MNKVSEKVDEISAQMAATSVKVSSARPAPQLDENVIVSIQSLQKSFGDTEVLRDVNIDVHRGEVVVVLGPSGSGKSTMLRCINLLEVPTGGHIYFEGKDITDKKTDINKLRTGIGMVFQSFNLFPHLSAKENVMLAQCKVLKRSKEEAEAIALEELRKVGLGDRADYMPSELSGGQQQRVAIARAIATHPPIIMADEPTGALDSKTGAHVLEILRELYRGGTTVILITHDNGIAATARRIVRISDGKVLEDHEQEVDWL